MSRPCAAYSSYWAVFCLVLLACQTGIPHATCKTQINLAKCRARSGFTNAIAGKIVTSKLECLRNKTHESSALSCLRERDCVNCLLMSALSAPAHVDLVPRCGGTTGSLGHDGWESFKRFNIVNAQQTSFNQISHAVSPGSPVARLVTWESV